jgi:thioredoxin 1
LTDANFDDEISKSDIPILVDFWAQWCMPCKKLAPILDEVSQEYDGKIKFAKLNVEEGQSTASRFGIMSVPTIVIFKDGKIHDQMVGLVAKEELKKKIDAVL